MSNKIVFHLLTFLCFGLSIQSQCHAVDDLDNIDQEIKNLPASAVSEKEKISWMMRQSFTIFSAEDSKITARTLSKIFENTGNMLTVFSNGQKLLTEINSTKPDLILMDGNMPELDGWATIEVLKATYTKDCPPIFAVASSDKEEKLRFMELGVAAFVEKPASKEALFLAIYDWFNRDSTLKE